ncbi:DNA processing protein [Haloactinopolyspora alba]|uniref:DNA processing protein n=1 Tax=Haloactinopolyspora alba TaxID=648780 RepID=A0A2P8EG80_9ACTN|nr:DNA-processing protein DprA [Haloactinopolyspora alba]PSL08466.1 DNA processing protein [Haloactinopolyspora alba]
MQSEFHDERVALLALLQTRPQRISWSKITEQIIDAGSATDVWNRLVPPTLTPPPNGSDPIDAAEQTISAWGEQGLRFVTFLDADYPAPLRGIHEAPPFLFIDGKSEPDDSAVAVVGSRKSSERGLAFARDVASALVGEGITVTAGLALGIDTAAHEAALHAGGRTVAVLPTGISQVYPKENQGLKARISETGLVISQFFPDAPPQKHTFLMRNATMSGYSRATVVVEAGEHSGARAQARMATEHGRPVILRRDVVDHNAWGKELADQPGVTIADTADDVVTTILGLIRSQELIDSTLRSLVEL